MSHQNKGELDSILLPHIITVEWRISKIWVSGFSKWSPSLFLLGKWYLKSQIICVIEERDEWLLW